MADGSEAWAIVPFLLWPRPVSRIWRKIVQPLPPPPSVRRSLPRCPSRGSSVCTCGPSRNGTARCVPVERSSLQSSDDAHVLRAQSLVAAAGIEDDRLALAQLLEHRAVPDGAPMHEIFLAVLALNKSEALIRNHF